MDKLNNFQKVILINKSSCLLILCLLIQQLIVASSTLWIAKLSQAVVLKQDFSLWLILFILSLFIVYVPSTAAAYFMNRAIFVSFKKYVEIFADSFKGKAQLRNNIEFKQERQPYLNNEAWLVIDESFRFSSYCLSTSFSVIFNVIALGFLIDNKLIISYITTLPLVVICIMCSKSLVETSAKHAQEYRAGMLQSLLPAWDSLLIGNSLNVDLWKNSFLYNHATAKKFALKSILFIECSATLSMFLSLFPVIGTLVWLIYQNLNDEVFLTMLIATLPRQILTLQYMSDIISFATQWNSIKARLSGLKRATIISEQIKSGGIISWGQIQAQKNNNIMDITSIDSILDLSQNYSCGRITLRGDNGTGKSSLLALIKEQLGEKAFLLPPYSDMFFKFHVNKSLSTGEKMIAALNEIEKNVKPQLLLLDEWDANLDTNNIDSISEKLNELAKQFCIIEVRHRI